MSQCLRQCRHDSALRLCESQQAPARGAVERAQVSMFILAFLLRASQYLDGRAMLIGPVLPLCSQGCFWRDSETSNTGYQAYGVSARQRVCAAASIVQGLPCVRSRCDCVPRFENDVMRDVEEQLEHCRPRLASRK